MRELAVVVPGPLDQVTGGYLFDRRLSEELRARGRAVQVVELGAGPAAAALKALPHGMTAVIDGLALPLLGNAAIAASAWLRLVGFVHHPLSEETGLSPQDARRLARLEARLLPRLSGVVCPSRRTAAALVKCGVAAARIAVTPPGTDKPVRVRVRSGLPRRLLCVGNVIPRKGYPKLVEALSKLADLDWTMVCIGSLARDAEAVQEVRQLITACGLDGRVRLAGEQGRAAVAAAYEAADAFVFASHHEGYGMVCAEAMAYGLPLVTTSAGAIAEVVPPEAGMLVPPGDADSLAAALRRLLQEPGLAERLAAGARSAAAKLPSWSEAAIAWEAAVDRLSGVAPCVARPGMSCGGKPF